MSLSASPAATGTRAAAGSAPVAPAGPRDDGRFLERAVDRVDRQPDPPVAHAEAGAGAYGPSPTRARVRRTSSA